MSKCKQCERLIELQSYIKEDLVPHTQIYIGLINKIKHTLETYEEFDIPIENIVEDYARKVIDISMDLVITIKEKR